MQVSEVLASLARLNVPDVSRDSVTCLQLNQVTWNNLNGWDSNSLSVSRSGGCRRGKRSKRVHCLFSIELLHETDNDVEQNDSSYYTTLNPRLDSERHSHCSNQDLGAVRVVAIEC